MSLNNIESLNLSDIDFKKCYFNPGCALSIHKPESNIKLLDILKKYFSQIKLHSICCRHEPKLPYGSTIINNCAGCDRRFRSLYDGINTITIWEFIDNISDFRFPSYKNLTVSIHDSCSFRKRTQVHEAVRSILSKMNINIIESEFSGAKSICCGDNFYSKIPLFDVHEFQKKRASQMPCNDVVVYCVSCIKSMTIGGKVAHHMVDLLLNEDTEVGELDLDIYHNKLQEYIDNHSR